MNLEYRLVEEKDAEFILRLRTNPQLNIFLNRVPEDIESQVEWIKIYKTREALRKEFYYIIFEHGKPCGTYRLYNINSISFTIGSWIFQPCSDLTIPIVTDLKFNDIGFNDLKLDVLLFDVRKLNKKVLSYHLLKKPLLYNEDELNYYFLLTKSKWDKAYKNVIDYFGIEWP